MPRFDSMALALGGWLVLFALQALAQDGMRSIPRLPAGTEVVDRASETFAPDDDRLRWNRLVLASQPRLASGDVDAIGESIRNAVSTLTVAIMASVQKDERRTEVEGQPRYRLADLGVGTCIQVDGASRIITLDKYNDMGVELGLIQRQLVLENERQFGRLRLVARTSTLAILDAPAMVYRAGQHVDRRLRHLIWVDSRSGALATLVWWLEDRDGSQVLSPEAARWLRPATQEQRIIHIDGNEITWGIPGRRAFAITDLPPGQPVDLPGSVHTLAARTQYSMPQIRELSDGLNKALHAARVGAAPADNRPR